MKRVCDARVGDARVGGEVDGWTIDEVGERKVKSAVGTGVVLLEPLDRARNMKMMLTDTHYWVARRTSKHLLYSSSTCSLFI